MLHTLKRSCTNGSAQCDCTGVHLRRERFFSGFKLKFESSEHLLFFSISPDVILCGWLGLKHQLTNSSCLHSVLNQQVFYNAFYNLKFMFWALARFWHSSPPSQFLWCSCGCKLVYYFVVVGFVCLLVCFFLGGGFKFCQVTGSGLPIFSLSRGYLYLFLDFLGVFLPPVH